MPILFIKNAHATIIRGEYLVPKHEKNMGDYLVEQPEENDKFDVFILHDVHNTIDKNILTTQNNQLESFLNNHPQFKLIIEGHPNLDQDEKDLCDKGIIHEEWSSTIKTDFIKFLKQTFDELKEQKSTGFGLIDSKNAININEHRCIAQLLIAVYRTQDEKYQKIMKIENLLPLMKVHMAMIESLIKESDICKKYETFIKSSDITFYDAVIKIKQFLDDQDKCSTAIDGDVLELDYYNNYCELLNFLLELKTLNELHLCKNNKGQEGVVLWLGATHCKRISSFLKENSYAKEHDVESISSEDLIDNILIQDLQKTLLGINKLSKNELKPQQSPAIDLNKFLTHNNDKKQLLNEKVSSRNINHDDHEPSLTPWLIPAAIAACTIYCYRDSIKSFFKRWFGSEQEIIH